jgi:NitT/TauT family transport system substrate-binding protein
MSHRTTPCPTRRRALVAIAGAGATLLLAGCGGGSTGSSGGGTEVRIGYFPNLTHAPALVADAEGSFSRHLDGRVSIKTFNAGPDVIQAIFSNSLDISYVGPNPTITAYTRSKGSALKVIAGSTAGGAALVVRPGITSASQLRGRRLSTPQLGNTQDVALRHWLSTQGLKTDVEGSGDVTILPQPNGAALTAFAAGAIDGAWVPEPYATQFVQKGAAILVDERALWPQGQFVTTNVVVRTQFLQQHPDLVRSFLDAHLDALQLIRQNPAKAQADVAAQIEKTTGQPQQAATMAAAWKNLTFTADPLPATLKASAGHAAAVGLLQDEPSDGFAGLWDLAPLDTALKARGLPEVATP